MARLRVRLEFTEKLLNHVSGSMGGIVGVDQRYQFMDEMEVVAHMRVVERTPDASGVASSERGGAA
jgi:hypothetical protein